MRRRFDAGTHVSVETKYGVRHHFIQGEGGRVYQNDKRSGHHGFTETSEDVAYLDAYPDTAREERSSYSRRETLDRAREKAGRGEGNYHVLFNNCEDATNEVANGHAGSDQYTRAAAVASLFAGPMAPVAFGTALITRKAYRKMIGAD